MDEREAVVVIAAVMRAAGVRQVRLSDEDLVRPDPDVLLRRRDDMRDQWVFELRSPYVVIEGEVDMRAIEA